MTMSMAIFILSIIWPLIWAFLYVFGIDQKILQNLEQAQRDEGGLGEKASSLRQHGATFFVPPLTWAAFFVSVFIWFYTIIVLAGVEIEAVATAHVLIGVVAASLLVINAHQTQPDQLPQLDQLGIREDFVGISEAGFLRWQARVKRSLEEQDYDELAEQLRQRDQFTDTRYIDRLLTDREGRHVLSELLKELEDGGVFARKAFAEQRFLINKRLEEYLDRDRGLKYDLKETLNEYSKLVQDEARETALKEPDYTLKRGLDLVIALLTFLIVVGPLPVLPMVAAALLLQFRGRQPMFYVSLRAGVNGKPFRLYQFRTLISDSHTNVLRRSRLGALLVWSGLDRLPMLINIIKGDMSFVGPHALYLPQLHYALKEGNVEIKEIAWRQVVRPGITGVAQVLALRSPKHYVCPGTLQLEIDYVKNWSLKKDLKISLLTLLLYLFFLLPNGVMYVLQWPRDLPPLDSPLIQPPKWLQVQSEA